MEKAMRYCLRYHRLDVDGVNVVCAEADKPHPPEDIFLCGACERGYCVSHPRAARERRREFGRGEPVEGLDDPEDEG